MLPNRCKDKEQGFALCRRVVSRLFPKSWTNTRGIRRTSEDQYRITGFALSIFGLNQCIVAESLMVEIGEPDFVFADERARGIKLRIPMLGLRRLRARLP
jgi:hypothetical protein